MIQILEDALGMKHMSAFSNCNISQINDVHADGAFAECLNWAARHYFYCWKQQQQ